MIFMWMTEPWVTTVRFPSVYVTKALRIQLTRYGITDINAEMCLKANLL